MTDPFFALMERGGPLMWVIFATASLAAAMLIERAITLFLETRRGRRDFEMLVSRRARPSDLAAQSAKSPLSRLMEALPWPEISTRDDLVKEVNVNLAATMARLEGSLPTIATLGSLLPMLGLLGTVMGMINVFDAIAIHGSGQPDAMARGISQALLTTASGLAGAIPVIFFHHLLVRRLGALMTVTEQSLHVILNRGIDDLRPAGEKRRGGD